MENYYTRNNNITLYFNTFKDTLIYCKNQKFKLTIIGKINEKEFEFSRENIKFILK